MMEPDFPFQPPPAALSTAPPQAGQGAAVNRKNLSSTHKWLWATTKAEPRMLIMGMLFALQLVSLIVCIVVLVPRMLVAEAGGPAVALAAAAMALVAWFFMNVFGIKEFKQQVMSQARINELLGMTEALQSADGYNDAAMVLKSTSLELLPDLGGALYVFNNSRDRLDLIGSWNLPEDFSLAESLLPSNCWTLKRGKHHINRPGTSRLRCSHHTGALAALEVPMIARGTVYGLLLFAQDDHPDIERQLSGIAWLAHAMAEAMSLTLSNISLQEKLRTQSLRDPLTGLYNRRYMEDALERYASLAERTGCSTSVLMVDLDNFKRLNDEHGHAKGDAVLRDVASQLVSALRPSDVVCRYGGEELVVIMPNCGIEDAEIKAEMLRDRIQGLSEAHGFAISASFGLASVPETAVGPVDVIPRADAALYAAKQAGKNCVMKAERRAKGDDNQPRLAIG
jgi:diguanylate cyclase (GGDEF)-like protein